MIVNVGNDVKGRGILALAYDTASMTKYGAKWKYVAKTNISEQIINDQKVQSGVLYNTDNNFPASYPVQVKVPGESSIIDSDTNQPVWEYNIGDELNNNAGFNDYIRKISREAGKAYGRDYAAKNGRPRYYINMTLDIGTNLFRIGDFIRVEIPSANWEDVSDVSLRVQEIKHTINTNGWNTQLVLEEDAELVI